VNFSRKCCTRAAGMISSESGSRRGGIRMHSAALGKKSGNPGCQIKTINGEMDLTVLCYYENLFFP